MASASEHAPSRYVMESLERVFPHRGGGATRHKTETLPAHNHKARAKHYKSLCYHALPPPKALACGIAVGETVN